MPDLQSGIVDGGAARVLLRAALPVRLGEHARGLLARGKRLRVRIEIRDDVAAIEVCAFVNRGIEPVDARTRGAADADDFTRRFEAAQR